MTVKDFRGKTIEAGSIIVYPVRRGSNMWLNQAVVLEVGNYTNYSGQRVPQLRVIPNPTVRGSKATWITKLNRVVVVE